MFKTLKQIKTDALDDDDSNDDNTMLGDFDNNADKTVNTKVSNFLKLILADAFCI